MNFWANNGDALRAAALRGLGVLLAPRFIVGEDLRSGTLEAVLGDFDAFLGVFMPSGDLDWARSFGGALNEGFLDVAQAASGQLWVTGEMQSDTDYGGGVLTSAGDYDGVVVRYLP